MPQLSRYLSFLLGKGGKPLYLKSYFKTLKYCKCVSDQPLQHTSLDLWCVCEAPPNLQTLQNFMYILHKFCTFPVTEGNEILHLHCSSQLQAENSSKNPQKVQISSFPHPESHEFLKLLIYLQLETSESPKVNAERHEFPALQMHSLTPVNSHK